MILKKYALSNNVDVDAVLLYVKPHNSFAGKQMNINKMPYINVKHCIGLLPKVKDWNDIIKLFEICFDVPEKAFWKTDVSQYYAAKKYMVSEFERIIMTENKIFASQQTDEHLWMMAGADRLKRFSDTLPLVQLGKILGQYPFDLGKKPYSEIFTLLVMSKTQNEVEIEYQKLNR